MACATESRTSCGTCVGAHSSQLVPRKSAVQFPGSIGACAIRGSWYSDSMRCPETFDTSPTEYRLTDLLSADFFRASNTAAELRSLFGPSSHCTLRVRRPSIAPQTLSATTATAESLIFPTKLTPAIFFESLSSKLATLPPITGQRASTACFMPGKRKSMPNSAVPSTLEGPSSRGKDLPTSL